MAPAFFGIPFVHWRNYRTVFYFIDQYIDSCLGLARIFGTTMDGHVIIIHIHPCTHTLHPARYAYILECNFWVYLRSASANDWILPYISRCDFIISHHMGTYVGILHKLHSSTVGYSHICTGMITRKKWDSVIQSRAPVYYVSLMVWPSVTQYDHIWVSSISHISSHHILPGNNQFSLGLNSPQQFHMQYSSRKRISLFSECTMEKCKQWRPFNRMLGTHHGAVISYGERMASLFEHWEQEWRCKRNLNAVESLASLTQQGCSYGSKPWPFCHRLCRKTMHNILSS